MQSQIDEIKKEYQEITDQLSSPEIVSDPRKMAELGKRQSELQEIITLISKYEKIEKEMKENAEIVNSETDPEMKDMAMNENIKLSAEKEKTEKGLESMLIPKDPNDSKMSLWKLEPEPEETNLLFLPLLFSECIPNMPKKIVGRFP